MEDLDVSEKEPDLPEKISSSFFMMEIRP